MGQKKDPKKGPKKGSKKGSKRGQKGVKTGVPKSAIFVKSGGYGRGRTNRFFLRFLTKKGPKRRYFPVFGPFLDPFSP
jgi:hypothetical protein